MRGKLGLFTLGLLLFLIATGLVSVTDKASNLALIIGGFGVLCMISVRFVGGPKT